MCGIRAFKGYLRDHGVDTWVDNTTARAALLKGSSRSELLNKELTRIREACHAYRCVLRVGYVPSALNPADGPSRGLEGAELQRDVRGRLKQFLSTYGELKAPPYGAPLRGDSLWEKRWVVAALPSTSRP